MNGTLTFIRRWLFIGVALFGLGGWVAKLQGAVELKADKDTIAEMARDIQEIKNKLTDMDARQRAFFCEGKPQYCR